MNAGNIKFYLALVLAATFIVQCLAAPSSKEDSAETHKHDTAETSAEGSKPDHAVVPGQLNGVPQLSSIHSSAENAGASTASPSAAHVRVRRNKHPIRYHAKTLRRERR